MAIKRRYVIANSDPYTDGTVRPPEELQAAVRRVRTVPLTIGHPPQDAKGIPEEYLLGKAEYQYDADNALKLGNLSFYTEYWDRLPKELQDNVVNHTNLPISPGYEFEWGEEPNVITKMVDTHLAVLVDEKPLCPLNTCGVNVRMESNSGYRYEQRTEAENPDKEPKKEIAPFDPSGLEKMLGEMQEAISDISKRLEEKEKPVVVEHEAKKEAETSPPQEKETVREPEPVPARETPASVPKPQDELERDPVFGGIVLKNRHDRSNE